MVISSPQVLTTTLSNPPNTITALDAYNNVVTDFAVDANPVTVTRTQGSAAPYTITGLGSGNDDTLDQAGDFVNGVADLTGKLVYSAGSGELIKFGVQAGSIVGESNEVLYQEPP